MVSFGTSCIVFLQLSCLFTAYTKLTSYASLVTDSDKLNQ